MYCPAYWMFDNFKYVSPFLNELWASLQLAHSRDVGRYLGPSPKSLVPSPKPQVWVPIKNKLFSTGKKGKSGSVPSCKSQSFKKKILSSPSWFSGATYVWLDSESHNSSSHSWLCLPYFIPRENLLCLIKLHTRSKQKGAELTCCLLSHLNGNLHLPFLH